MQLSIHIYTNEIDPSLIYIQNNQLLYADEGERPACPGRLEDIRDLMLQMLERKTFVKKSMEKQRTLLKNIRKINQSIEQHNKQIQKDLIIDSIPITTVLGTLQLLSRHLNQEEFNPSKKGNFIYISNGQLMYSTEPESAREKRASLEEIQALMTEMLKQKAFQKEYSATNEVLLKNIKKINEKIDKHNARLWWNMFLRCFGIKIGEIQSVSTTEVEENLRHVRSP